MYSYIPEMRLKDTTPAQKKILAAKLGTTYDTIRQVAAGRSMMSSMTAIELERAGEEMGLFLPREAHATACAVCEFARECRPLTTIPEVSKVAVEITIPKSRLDAFGNEVLAGMHVIKTLAGAGIPVDGVLFMRGVKTGVLDTEFVEDLAGVGQGDYVFRWRP